MSDECISTDCKYYTNCEKLQKNGCVTSRDFGELFTRLAKKHNLIK